MSVTPGAVEEILRRRALFDAERAGAVRATLVRVWNLAFPIGRPVRYGPKGAPPSETSKTTSVATDRDGQVVVMLEGVVEAVSLTRVFWLDMETE